MGYAEDCVQELREQLKESGVKLYHHPYERYLPKEAYPFIAQYTADMTESEIKMFLASLSYEPGATKAASAGMVASLLEAKLRHVSYEYFSENRALFRRRDLLVQH